MGNVQSLPNESYSGITNSTFAISPTWNDARSSVGTHFASQLWDTWQEPNWTNIVLPLSCDTLICSENSIFKTSIRSLELERRERDDHYLFGLRNGTRNECLSYTPEMMYLHWKASKCSNSENSTFKKSIRILEQERRERDDDYLFGLPIGTINACLSYTPEMKYLHSRPSKCSNSDPFADISITVVHTDLTIDTFRDNVLSRLNKLYSDRMNRTFTISPTSTDVMSFDGTHVCEIGQTVRSGIQLYPRPYESCSTIDENCVIYDDVLPKIEISIKEFIHNLFQKCRKPADDLCDLANGTRIECRSYTPEKSKQTYLHCTASECSESHSDTFADMSMTVVQSSLNLPRSFLKRGTHTDLPIDTLSDVMSLDGTHVCKIGQTVRLGIQLYPRPYESNYDQDRWMDRSSFPTIDWTCFENCFKEITELIHILEQETRKLVDDLCGLANGTRIECRSYTPEMSRRMYLHWTESKCSESHSDLIADMSKKRIQSSLEFRTCVKRGSHMVLHREKLSYDHHMLVADVYENSIRVIEYAFPEDTIDRIDTLSETSLGQIQYKTIIIEELFQPNTSKVYLVYNPRYPKTTEQLNTAMERATSRIGEKMYSISHSNCENFVIWALVGDSTSSQWINAGVLHREAGDILEKILPVVVGNAVDFLLQDPMKRSINDTVGPNQKCSKLSTILRRFKYCIATIYLLLKLVIGYMKWGLSPGRHNIVIIMTVVFRTFIFIFGPRFQLLEIDKFLFQTYFMSRENIFREMFKIIFVLCTGMTTRVSRNLTILKTCVLCLYQLMCFILAGILFDAFIYFYYNLC